MSNIADLSSEQLIRAGQLKQQIEKLTRELDGILGNGSAAKASTSRKRRGPSPEGIARIKAAQKKRWAKTKKVKKPAGKKTKMSPQAKAALSAKLKKIWADRKAKKAQGK
jgi:hypothetical protein